jgi:thiol-disulfide isomerase/thioredoxin
MSTFRRGLAPLLLAVVLPLAASAQEDAPLAPETQVASDLQKKADDELRAKKNDEAVATYEKLLAHLAENKAKFTDFPESQQKAVRAHAYYNMACAFALAGKREPSLDALQKAIEAGFYDWQHMEKDDDLASVRGEPRWKELMQVLRGTDKEAKRLEKLAKDTLKDKPLFDFAFEGTTLDSQKIASADFKGKTVILVCFGLWNPRCKEMAPALTELARLVKERGDGVEIVVLDWERTDPTEAIEKDVKDFAAEMKMTFPICLMKEKDPTLDRIPSLNAFPTTLWIDKAGKVRGRWDDEKILTVDELDAITKALVHEAPKGAEKTPAEKKAEPEKAPEKKPDKKKDDKKDDDPF